ncbi:MAG: polyprenyl synthetase family protein [Planctomycetes bacterium]|nr:polyprenyl synthetase family protein [Planctomycetota bacterium]
MEAWRETIDAALERFLPPAKAIPAPLHEAMRYSVFAGGKRLRPALALAACEATGGVAGDVLAAACALECIHTYSLIHDDLPAMDDDDFRRGKPSCHKAYGEATAILAGDGLLTFAFELVAAKSPPDLAAALVREIAEAAGTTGMVGGQVLDLQAERDGDKSILVESIHAWKTAALIRASVKCGGIAARAPAGTIAALGAYGTALGLAFQIVDDCLDVESSTSTLGKTAGKDAEAQKVTYPSVYGLERARQMAADAGAQARAALTPLGARKETLAALVGFVLERTT